MKNVLIDTSVYLAFFSKDNRYSLSSHAFFESLLKERMQIILPVIVLTEVIDRLRRVEKKDLEEITRQLILLRVVEMDEYWLADFFFKSMSTEPLSIRSQVILATAQMNEAVVVSWNQKLLDLSREKYHIYSPSEYFVMTEMS